MVQRMKIPRCEQFGPFRPQFLVLFFALLPLISACGSDNGGAYNGTYVLDIPLVQATCNAGRAERFSATIEVTQNGDFVQTSGLGLSGFASGLEGSVRRDDAGRAIGFVASSESSGEPPRTFTLELLGSPNFEEYSAVFVDRSISSFPPAGCSPELRFEYRGEARKVT